MINPLRASRGTKDAKISTRSWRAVVVLTSANDIVLVWWWLAGPNVSREACGRSDPILPHPFGCVLWFRRVESPVLAHLCDVVQLWWRCCSVGKGFWVGKHIG